MKQHFPQLDGLRTIAVLLVIGTHTGLISGGYVGVDVFFVLSGYLITTILLNERESGRWNIRAFWVRRMRRLYPALIVMLLLTIPFDSQLISGDTAHRIAVVGAAATYTTDFLIPTFSARAMAHLWSLSVEEQFYLLWPLGLPLVLRYRRAGICGLVAVTVATLTILCVGHDQTVLYTLYARGGVLLIGCLLAFVANRGLTVTRRLAAPCTIALGLLAYSAPQGQQAGLFCLLTALVTAGLIASILQGGMLARTLSWQPLVWIGQRSYAVYLWQLPVIGLLTREQFAEGSRHLAMFTVATAVSVGLAALSGRYVEGRFYARRLRPAVAAGTTDIVHHPGPSPVQARSLDPVRGREPDRLIPCAEPPTITWWYGWSKSD